ncbi:glycosyl transferase family 2 [Leptolyngbya valderiana BDU 20041]|nr:glycosyl transferase family 2 [Leptolyngbya valderiana BDU 20041]
MTNALPFCSFVVVNYNGLRHLRGCFEAVQASNYPSDRIEIIAVDNGSKDGSIEYINRTFPQVRTLVNSSNNFAAALNLGVELSQGEYVAFLNNDARIHPDWLRHLVEYLEDHFRVGAAAGKIRFPDGRINSVGHRRLPDFYWEDIGFGEPDEGQFDKPMEVEGLCWAATLFRRECLDHVGPVDEEFVMYFEDVEYSKRCYEEGWPLHYVPYALVEHEVGGSSAGTGLTAYFCNRNRFLYLAKHEPQELLHGVQTSVFWIEKHYSLLYDTLLVTFKKLIESHPEKTVNAVLPQLCQRLSPVYGARDIDKLLARVEVILGYRKPSIAIYDPALHFIGGGQRYLATLASILQDRFDITFIGNRPVAIAQLESWYGLNLSQCSVKIIPLPFFEKRGARHIDATWVTADRKNPFDAIAKESQHYDIFLNANQLTKVTPLSPISVFFCHFPDSYRTAYFAVDRYTFIVVNSNYTTKWLQKRWRLNPSILIYPPVEMEGEKREKENIILAVGRFEEGGTKKQLELIEAFDRICRENPEIHQTWKLILVGGSRPKNGYLQQVEKQIETVSGIVELHVNAELDELKSLYAKAKIFWHLSGLHEFDPERFEHFGMATVEAMQNYCVPVVFNGGGQREIIESGKSGFLIDSIEQLCARTRQLINQPELLETLSQNARDRSRKFGREPFENKIKNFFDILYQEYATLKLPDPAEIAKSGVMRD